MLRTTDTARAGIKKGDIEGGCTTVVLGARARFFLISLKQNQSFVETTVDIIIILENFGGILNLFLNIR